MLIDWFTVGAQVLNFLLLVWLMKRFLYKPILQAIDEREKRIAAQVADAHTIKAEAQRERDEFRQKNESFDQKRAALLNKAMDETNAERHRLLDEARQEADSARAKWQETLRGEHQNLKQDLTGRAGEEVFSIARKTLADLATTALEERVGEVFIRRLRAMDGRTRDELAATLRTASTPAVVRSAFDLPAEQRAAIQHALNETFSADIRLQFEIRPELVSGIELITNGHKLAWSIADYLASLEQRLGELLKEKDQTDATVEPALNQNGESQAHTTTP
ncbi:MAG: F0F1 ATP synthase subunit delta [Nitrospira sp.]|nr:F0F1 ATP synthase subunit delta [Nitrospira sp.]